MKELMTVGSFIGFGVESLKRNLFKFVGLIIVAFIGLILIGYIAMALGDTIGSVISFVASILIAFGMIQNTINITRGQPIDFAAFYNAGPMKMINFLVAMILVSIIVSIGFILLIIPGIILAYMLILVPYLVIDQDMGALEAISKSMELTKGYKMDIFAGHFVVMIIVWAVSFLIITIPLTIPFAMFVQIYPYLVLSGQITKGDPITDEEPVSEPETASE